MPFALSDQAKVLFEEVHRAFLRTLGPSHRNTMQAARALEQF
jgi:hypothetical protein